MRRLWTCPEVSYLVDLAWDAGRVYERERIATGVAELDATWRPPAQRSYERQVAERVAEMERHAVTDWPGVDNGGVLPSADWSPALPKGRAA